MEREEETPVLIPTRQPPRPGQRECSYGNRCKAEDPISGLLIV
jgi:hypothetical protein